MRRAIYICVTLLIVVVVGYLIYTGRNFKDEGEAVFRALYKSVAS